MSLEILSPGALSTIQDAGRCGYMQYGVTPGGPMDYAAFTAANRLVGNPDDMSLIEMTLMGITGTFHEATEIAITGADMNAKLDGFPVRCYERLQVAAGQTLSMGMAVNGCRSYLAVQGGFSVPVVMGSQSTNLRCHLGGFEGRPLAAGDRLEIGMSGSFVHTTSEAAYPLADREWKRPQRYESHVTVHVVEGPQAEYFAAEGKRAFYESRYRVGAQSDRMGMRLEGPAVAARDGVDIISDGILFGSIQITNGGTPIIMMADHQTTGGYAKIGTVCTFDLPKLAQLRPGDEVSFEVISTQEAERLYLEPTERFGSHKLTVAVRDRREQSDSLNHRVNRRRLLQGGWKKAAYVWR